MPSDRPLKAGARLSVRGASSDPRRQLNRCPHPGLASPAHEAGYVVRGELREQGCPQAIAAEAPEVVIEVAMRRR